MGDRKCKPGMTCNSVALELCNFAWNKPALRDELYLHVCRQTTENPRKCVTLSLLDRIPRAIFLSSLGNFVFVLYGQQGQFAARLGAASRVLVLFPAIAETGTVPGRLHQPPPRSRSQLHRSRQVAHSCSGILTSSTDSIESSTPGYSAR